MDQIRLGTIGTGVIVRSVLDQVMKTEGICLQAVYSRSLEKGRDLAECYGAQAVYTDMEDFLSDEKVNCVYIASPNLLHYPQAAAALEAGKHVLCEKPLCTNAKDARELMALARKKDRMLLEAVPTAFLPNLQLISQNLSAIGRLRLVQGNYSQYSSRYDQVRQGQLPNVFNPAFGGGCLMDLNYYNVYLNVSLFGKPESLQYYPNRHPGGVDTSGTLVMTYPDFVSQATAAKDTWFDSDFSIQGEDGYIRIPGGSNGLRQVCLVTREGTKVLSCQPEPERLLYEIQAVTGLLLREDRAAIDRLGEISLAVMEMLEAGRRSAGILFPGETE